MCVHFLYYLLCSLQFFSMQNYKHHCYNYFITFTSETVGLCFLLQSCIHCCHVLWCSLLNKTQEIKSVSTIYSINKYKWLWTTWPCINSCDLRGLKPVHSISCSGSIGMLYSTILFELLSNTLHCEIYNYAIFTFHNSKRRHFLATCQ